MDDKQKKTELLNYVKSLVEAEQALRAKYDIGDNYRSITNRFQSMLAYAQEHLAISDAELVDLSHAMQDLADDEQYVYVYLFNARGKTLSRWCAMLTTRNFAEYSVNRPIYQSEQELLSYIRGRSNSDEHAYLIMKIKQSDILQGQEATNTHDAVGHALLKLKEKSLTQQGLVAFVYKNERYRLVNGQLILLP